MIWGYGSDKFLVNGLGSIFISSLMLEQIKAYTFSSSVTKRQRKQIYSNGGCCDRNYGIYAVFLDKRVFCVVAYIPAQWVMLSIYGIIGRKSKRVCGS